MPNAQRDTRITYTAADGIQQPVRVGMAGVVFSGFGRVHQWVKHFFLIGSIVGASVGLLSGLYI